MGLAARPLRLVMLAGLTAACAQGSDEARIVAREYRFEPAVLSLSVEDRVILVLDNQGRETHEFTSLLLRDPRVEVLAGPGGPPGGRPDALRLPPGHRVRISLRAPPGTYPFHCRIRGHRGMKGTIILR